MKLEVVVDILDPELQDNKLVVSEKGLLVAVSDILDPLILDNKLEVMAELAEDMDLDSVMVEALDILDH